MWLYRLLLFVLFPFLLVLTAVQAFKCQSLRYFLQRMGLALPEIPANGIWCHAASVGEVNAVRPLLLKLQNEDPEISITLSTNTHTSAAVAARSLPANIRHVYLPLDYGLLMWRFLTRLQPRLALVVETELWPNLYRQCQSRGVPITIINARLSKKTLNAPGWMKALYRDTLALTHRILARSEADAVHFLALGAAAEKVITVGNIKMALPLDESISPVALSRDYVLAASTRDDEEWRIVEAWNRVNKDSTLLLVIVPRHPQRLNDILQQLNPQRTSIAVRSRNDPVDNTTQVYIADTIGEMKSFIAGARFVVMGGSFVSQGGQNILEVAQQARAVVFGPSMENFADEAAMFLSANAAMQVDEEGLSAAIQQLLDKPKLADELGRNGKQLLVNGQQVLDEYYRLINSET